MKKILIVGGGQGQLPLIEAAKKEGYYTIICDFAGDQCPGAKYADKLYSVSTRDVDAVYDVAKNEQIDGIISNSEPSMLCVTEVGERLGLIGNPLKSIQTFISKSEFRALQNNIGVYSPKHVEVDSWESALKAIADIEYPIFVKPGESSGSRGSVKIEKENLSDFKQAFNSCMLHTRNKRVVIEEYVEMSSNTTIEADIFVCNGEILWDGIYSTLRAEWSPIIPMVCSFPSIFNHNQLNIFKEVIGKTIKAGGITFGQYNVEAYFNNKGELFVIEINVRQGGNNLPAYLKVSTGIDYDKLLVTSSVGDFEYWDEVISTSRNYNNIIHFNLYSKVNGIYEGIKMPKYLQNKVVCIKELMCKGDLVHECVNASDIVANIDFKFDSKEEMDAIRENLSDIVTVKLKND